MFLGRDHSIKTCGFTKHADAIAFPEMHNVSHCLYAKNIVLLDECRELFEKMFNDIHCAKRVKIELAKRGYPSEHKCDCPEACESISYDTEYSTAVWPGGPELDAAYDQLIKQRLIPLIEGKFGIPEPGMANLLMDFNLPEWWLLWPDISYLRDIISQEPWVKTQVVQYLSNPENKREILNDFVRITVYNKDLTVEVTQDVAEYTFVDILSDIGMFIITLADQGFELLMKLIMCIRSLHPTSATDVIVLTSSVCLSVSVCLCVTSLLLEWTDIQT